MRRGARAVFRGPSEPHLIEPRCYFCETPLLGSDADYAAQNASQVNRNTLLLSLADRPKPS
jgi:hypothetical protein